MTSAHPSALLRLALAALLLAVVLGGPAAALASGGSAGTMAPASQTNPITLEARAGFDGYYKDAALGADAHHRGQRRPRCQGTCRWPWRAATTSQLVIARQVELPTQSRREIFLYIPTEGFVTSVKVRLIRRPERSGLADRCACSRSAPATCCMGVLAGSSTAYNVLADVDPISGSAFVAQLEAGRPAAAELCLAIAGRAGDLGRGHGRDLRPNSARRWPAGWRRAGG